MEEKKSKKALRINAWSVLASYEQDGVWYEQLWWRSRVILDLVLYMSFETMRRRSPDFFASVLSRLMSAHWALREAQTFWACDVEVAFSRMSGETARKVNSDSEQV